MEHILNIQVLYQYMAQGSKPDANQRVDMQMCTELAYDVYPTTHMAEMQDAVAQQGRN